VEPPKQPEAQPQGGNVQRAALRELRELLAFTPKPAWATPVLVGLGLATSLAETLGITLIVAFLHAAMGQGAEAAAALGGWLGAALARAQEVLGSPSRMALAILTLILLRAGLSHANRLLSARIGEQINETARNRVHEQFLDVSYAFMQRHKQAQLYEVLGNETWLIADAYESLTRIVIGACSIAVFVGFLFALSWPITLAVAAGSIVLTRLLRRLARPAQALGREVKRVHEKLGQHMLMTVECLRTIRAYGQKRLLHDRFLRSSAEARAASVALARLKAVLDPITEVGYLVMLCVIVAGAVHWGTDLPTLLAATALLYRLQPHVRDVEGHLLYLAQIEPQLRSVRAMLRTDDKTYDDPGRQPVSGLRRSIVFEQVSFSYEPGLAPALDRVSFEIPAGRITALVGASGAGKTTAINLLLRLYAPQQGTIRVDGVPLQDLRRDDWLGLLAAAGQDVDLIEGTVLDNIRMAGADASDAQVLEAARAAGVDEFVQQLPDGYDTWIGQQGHRFSGGQRQRLSLARALLRDPQLLILDEATNALDADLEHRIRETIEQRLAGRTVLIISHRDSALRGVDHVIRLDGGRVVPPQY
jgi:ABC-type multidrug transport system fused ATPase/permease subunit